MKAPIHEAKNSKKTARKPRALKAKRTRKSSAAREVGFFESLSAQFRQVAPLDWVPTTYQTQIKMAKPILIVRPRKKSEKTTLH